MRNTFTKALIAAVTAGTLVQAASAQNVLINESFEQTCPAAGDWTQFGNVSSINFYTFTGTRAIKMFGPFCCPLGYSGFYQDAPAAEGQVWEASAQMLNPDWDALSWNDNGTPDDPSDDRGSRVFIEVSFLDANGVFLTSAQQYISTKIGAPTNFLHVLQTVSNAVAPAGTATVRIQGTLEQAGYVGGAAWYDSFSLSQVGLPNVLTNSSFEDQAAGCVGSPYVGWVNFGNGQGNAGENPRTGSYAAKLFGGYNSPIAASGWYQNAPATPGSTWQATGWGRTASNDLIQNNNDVFLTLEFFNADGDNITGFETHLSDFRSEGIVTGVANNLTYSFFQTGEAVAPEGTTTVRCLIFQRQVDYAGGATWWDDMSLVQTDAVTCFADYNQDGGVDGTDVEAFFIDWSQGLVDVNLDGGVDGADVEAFFVQWQAGGC
jgi:hypothetical protein